jgi:CII-binding regulator of phage lambda lysogenization HflD
MCVHKNSKSLYKHMINRHLSYNHLHQLKMRNRLKKKIKFKTMSHLKKKISIKGEMKLIKERRMNKRFKIKDHLTQESTKQFNEITPSTSSLVTFKRG